MIRYSDIPNMTITELGKLAGSRFADTRWSATT